MSDTDIHSCGYYCDRHACIVAQRNELRDKLFEGQAVKTYSGGKPNYTQPIEKEWVGLTDDEVGDIGCDFATLGGDIEGKNWFAFYLAIEAKLKEKNI
jgi:hypothetical protein